MASDSERNQRQLLERAALDKNCSRDFLAEDLPRKGRRGQHPLPALISLPWLVDGNDSRREWGHPWSKPMANPTTTDTTWVDTLQDYVREVAGSGWLVNKSGSKVRLRVRSRELTDGGCWTRTLPIAWELGCIGPVTTMVQNLKRQVADGLSLDAAWEQLTGAGIGALDSPTEATLAAPNWKLLAQDFLRWREENGTQIGSKTMAAEKRYLNAALLVLSERRPPTRAYDLLSQAVKPWRGSPRAKKQAVETVMRFLAYGHDHRGLSADWILPAHQKADFLESSKKSAKATLTGPEILELIDSCPSTEWQSVLTFLAAFGLRPEELFHLSLRVNPDTGKKQFWCGYEKVSGKCRTSQRWLWPIPLEDTNGRQVELNLAGAWEAGLVQFPPMKDRGEALSQYLRRLPLWQRWRRELAADGVVLRPYVFRDSYSLRGHLKGIPASQMSAAMGHSLAVHSASYVWSDASSTAAVFEALVGAS